MCGGTPSIHTTQFTKLEANLAKLCATLLSSPFLREKLFWKKPREKTSVLHQQTIMTISKFSCARAFTTIYDSPSTMTRPTPISTPNSSARTAAIHSISTAMWAWCSCYVSEPMTWPKLLQITTPILDLFISANTALEAIRRRWFPSNPG